MNMYKTFGPLKENVIRSYTQQIVVGLEYLHSKWIIHHDLKGANILIDSRGKLKLSDFG